MSRSELVTKNKNVYRRFIQEIFNDGRLDQLSELVSESYILHDAPPGMPSGPEAIKQIVSMFRTGFPDLVITIDHLIGEGDMLAAKSTTQGTHLGNIFGIPATGKLIKISGLTMVSIKNGKLAASWVRNDMVGLIEQLEANKK